jgi:hypothetical protein
MLARHSLILSEQQVKQPFHQSSLIAASLADDAVEYILISIAEHLSLSVSEKVQFAAYFDLIDKAIQPKRLTHRPQMLRLHSIRNATKHKAIRIDRSEIESMIHEARGFATEVSSLILGIEFSTFGYQEMLMDENIRHAISEAERHLQIRNYESCLHACRKVSFLILEESFDQSRLTDTNSLFAVLMGYTAESPEVLSAKKYIDTQAATLFDFVQLNLNSIEYNLMRLGLSPNVFHNIEALAPRVYKGLRTNHEWVYERDFQKIQHPNVEHHCVLCLQNAITLALADQAARIQRKTAYSDLSFVSANIPRSPVYERATETSSILGYTIEEDSILVIKEVPSLDRNNGFYLTADYDPISKLQEGALGGPYRRPGYTKVFRKDD